MVDEVGSRRDTNKVKILDPFNAVQTSSKAPQEKL